MKVYLSKYRNHWLSPYTILEKVLFWKDWENIDYDEPWVEKWANRLEPFCIKLQKVLDFFHPRINYIKIDRYDTWDMDKTLSPIILPMLKQLKVTKQGAPMVDDDDVPEELKSTSAPPKENDYDTDDNHFKRWEYIMDEMIWAFEQLVDDNWEDQYYTGESDYIFVRSEENGLMVMEKGPKHTQEWDREGWTKHHKRIDNGLRLFGTYYRGLWD